MQMRVLRLEHNNEGVFSGSVVSRSIAKVIEDRGGNYPELAGFHSPLSPFRHDPPDEDVPAWGKIHRSDWNKARNYYCGFMDEAQLLRWFDVKEVREVMSAFGVMMLEYDIRPELVLIGTAQIMFWKAKATLISTIPMPIFAF